MFYSSMNDQRLQCCRINIKRTVLWGQRYLVCIMLLAKELVGRWSDIPLPTSLGTEHHLVDVVCELEAITTRYLKQY